MKRRILIMIIAAVAVACVFAGCRKSSETDETENTTEAESTVPEDTAADTTSDTTVANDSTAADSTAAISTGAVTDYVPVDPVSSSVFDNSLFIGDSRTVGLNQYADLGKADVFATSGMNIFRVMKESVSVKGIGETTLDSLLSSKKYDRIFIMLGMNEIGYDHGAVARKYESVVGELRQKAPDSQIAVCANLHIVHKRSQADEVYNNAGLNEINAGMKALCNGSDIVWIDVNPLFDDENGALREEYTVDDFHLIGKYYAQWAQWLAKQVG